MNPDHQDLITRLSAASPDCGRHSLGYASAFDEAECERQDALFADVVKAFTAAHGEPLAEGFVLPGCHVERAVFWSLDGKTIYALLEYHDNTRIRELVLGVCRDGELAKIPPKRDWWSIPV